MLLRFRVGVLPQKHINAAYDAMEEFVQKAGGLRKNVANGKMKPIKSNVMGYFDKWSIQQNGQFKRTGIKKPGECKICSFNSKNPEKFEQILPLIKDIDRQYKKLCPKEYKSQRDAAEQTEFHIPGTSFSTVTTNFNLTTGAHTDRGDWPEGFGNLVVIERGSPYTGCYTGFPQYGIAVDVREGDFLAMDVHRVHANTEIDLEDETSIRLSLVCYLRKGTVEKCSNQRMYDQEKLKRRLSVLSIK